MKTLIFGHKNPDTDSVMSSVALSYLENASGKNTEPRVLGDINKETEYALNYFNIKKPRYLNDVKLQLNDVNYHKGLFLNEEDSIYECYQLMLQKNITGIPIVKDDNTFAGLITIKDTSRHIIRDDIDNIYTSYDNILKVLKGKEILRFDEEIMGNLLVAAYRSTTIIESVKLTKDHILIVGDRHSIIEYAVKSGVSLIILTGYSNLKQEHIEIAKQNRVNIIKTEFDTYHIARLITLCNYTKTLFSNFNPIKFYDTTYVDDVLDINKKLRHTNYPIIDKNNKCLGLLKITDLNNNQPKQVILVDHNEPAQSVDGLEEAIIEEIVDHHNLGTITTKFPVNYRNMAVGSTCTIIFKLYKERNIQVPKEIAGCLLSGIISDTLILRSPTTTIIDKQAVDELSKILDIDYEEYGLELLKSGTSLEGMTPDDVIHNDYKQYTINNNNFAIGQFYTMNFEDIEKDLNSYINELDNIANHSNFNLVCLYVTDIMKNGSYIIFNNKGKHYLETAYDLDNIEQGHFIENTISRKKDVVPVLMSIFES